MYDVKIELNLRICLKFYISYLYIFKINNIMYKYYNKYIQFF